MGRPESPTTYLPKSLTDASPPPPPSSPKDSEPITPPAPPFDIEQAAFSATFLEIHGVSMLERHGIAALDQETTDQAWALAGPRAQQDHRLREERQAIALRSLSEICSLSDEEYQAWVRQQLPSVRKVATFGKALYEEGIQADDGPDTNLLDQMIAIADTRFTNAKEIAKRTSGRRF